MTDPDEITSEFPTTDRKRGETEAGATTKILNLRSSVKKCYSDATDLRVSLNLKNGKADSMELAVRDLRDVLGILERLADGMRSEEK